MTTNEVVVLQTSDLPHEAVAELSQNFQLVRFPEPGAERDRLLRSYGDRIRAIAGSGKGKVDAALLAALPNLELISVTSAGLDGIDTAEADRRSVPIFNTSTVLADDVADLALWLVLGMTRQLVEADRFVRAGTWSQGAYALGKTIAGMKIGILGLGHIGKATARRLEVLGATIGYSGRSEQQGITYDYFSDVRKLAEWSETLIVSCPATSETRRIINKDVLAALGRDGILVNISRGQVIDEDALVDAIANGRLYGAGLDVFDDEPSVPAALINSKRTILLPHIGSATVGTRQRMWQSMVEVLLSHFGREAASWRK